MFEDRWPEDPNYKKGIALALIPAVLMGFLGYRLLLSTTPVSKATALQRFRAQTSTSTTNLGLEESTADDSDSRDSTRRTRKKSATRAKSSRSDAESTAPVNQSQGSDQVSAAPAAPGTTPSNRRDRGSEWEPGHPAEGVYSWATDGYESFSGSRRRFPSETQRIVTMDGPTTWTNHHYFSEERQSWYQVHTDEEGFVVNYQRNKIVFGPVTRDVTIKFVPPMRVGRAGSEVGETWKGSWEGKTSGTYEGRTFEHTFMTIGGERVEVWGVEMHIILRGETEGEVHSKTWVSPKHHVPVKEHYVQDVQSGPGNYHAEWDMTLKSLKPEQ